MGAWQYNFAGLDTSGNFCVFDTPEEGISAHLQRLFAMATGRPLPTGTRLADPDFETATRGLARDIESMDGRWPRAQTGYGAQIATMFDEMSATVAAAWAPAEWARTLRRNAALRVQALLQRAAVGAPPGDAPLWVATPGVLTVTGDGAAHAEPAWNSAELYAYTKFEFFPAFYLDPQGKWYRVMLPTGNRAWVPAASAYLTPSDPETREKPVVVLDAGHGGSETGAIGPSGAMEKDLTLAIVLSAANELEARGFKVWRARDADADVALRYRTDLANAAEADCFVSFHLNAGSPGSRGTEAYWQCGSEHSETVQEQSRRLACLVQSHALQAIADHGGCAPHDRYLQCRMLDQAGQRDYYHVLRETAGPAALLEAMFITDPAEEACLLNPSLQADLATALATAVVRYLTSTTMPQCNYKAPAFGL